MIIGKKQNRTIIYLNYNQWIVMSGRIKSVTYKLTLHLSTLFLQKISQPKLLLCSQRVAAILFWRPDREHPVPRERHCDWPDGASRVSDKSFLFGAKEGRHGGAERRGRAGLWCRVHSEQTAEKGRSRETNGTIDTATCFLTAVFNEPASSVGLFSFRESWSFWWSGGDGRPSK